MVYLKQLVEFENTHNVREEQHHHLSQVSQVKRNEGEEDMPEAKS